MKQFVLKLLEEQRPIIRIEDFYSFDAMLDTGAIFPIWTAEEDLLNTMGAKLKIKNIAFGGFREMHMGNVYILPFLKIGSLIYPNFHLISCENEKIPAHMLLTATMFHDLIYEINTKTNNLTITIPDEESAVRNLVIEDSKGVAHILCNSGSIK